MANALKKGSFLPTPSERWLVWRWINLEPVIFSNSFRIDKFILAELDNKGHLRRETFPVPFDPFHHPAPAQNYYILVFNK